MANHRDVVIVGSGHNGLVAAGYLARAGFRVTVLEAAAELGGAVAGGRPFPGVDVTLSRYSYLVSLLPRRIVAELDLDLTLRSRRVASYTPYGGDGLLVEREAGAATVESFRRLTGGDQEFGAYSELEQRLQTFARVVEPTFTEPLPRRSAVQERVDPATWGGVVEQPIGRLIEASAQDDLVRGVLLTDALIGTFAAAHEESLRQNRCFLYHVVGRGTGEWLVPVGGMGAVARAMERAARRAGAELRPSSPVTAIEPAAGGGGSVVCSGGEVLTAPHVLAGCAPGVLAGLLAEPAGPVPSGSQTKINLVLRRLPRFISGIDPATGFAGTLHLGQGYGQLQRAYDQAAGGALPNPLPCEAYCHTLTDPSILGPDAARAGWHTITVFALHTPAELFRGDPDGMRRAAGDAALRTLQSVLAEPLEDCVARDDQGRLCVEVASPLDLEQKLRMPGGHIFHGDLSWPWLEDDEPADTAAQRWGVATDHPGILLCGSGARRGGAVSGLGGHNAAMAILADRRRRQTRSN